MCEVEQAPAAARRGFATRAIHAAVAQPAAQRPSSVPIYLASTFRFSSSEEFAAVIGSERHGYVYSRGYGNPTVGAFEAVMASLEGTEMAFGCASGMAAIHAVCATLALPGGRIVSSREIYGGTASLFSRVLPQWGMSLEYVDPHDLDSVEAALSGASAFFVETIANPTCEVADLASLARLCRENGAVSIVDSTFATPYLCRPAETGFDYVVHSATKYIGGHSDVIAGVVCTGRDRWQELRATAIDIGGTMGPFEAWLCLRGCASLALRMERHCSSAMTLAAALESHPHVRAVHYPGLPGHQSHGAAARQLRSGCFGGMLAFEVEGGVAGAASVCDSLEVAWLAASLGGGHTLVEHPASTTHRQLDPEVRRASGIADGLVRVSVGLEDVEDLLVDFDQALGKLR